MVLISIQLKLTKEKKKNNQQIKESTNAIDLEHSVKRKVTTKKLQLKQFKGEQKKIRILKKSLSQHGHLALGEVFNYLFTP